MTVHDITASAPVLAAIDISKERHEVLIEAPDKKRRRRVGVLNNFDEFDRLIGLMRTTLHPLIERMCRAADLGRYRAERRPTGRIFGFVFRHHANGAAADFRRKLVCRLACHRPYFSRVGVSGKAEAAHFGFRRRPQLDVHETGSRPSGYRRVGHREGSCR